MRDGSRPGARRKEGPGAELEGLLVARDERGQARQAHTEDPEARRGAVGGAWQAAPQEPEAKHVESRDRKAPGHEDQAVRQSARNEADHQDRYDTESESKAPGGLGRSSGGVIRRETLAWGRFRHRWAVLV